MISMQSIKNFASNVGSTVGNYATMTGNVLKSKDVRESIFDGAKDVGSAIKTATKDSNVGIYAANIAKDVGKKSAGFFGKIKNFFTSGHLKELNVTIYDGAKDVGKAIGETKPISNMNNILSTAVNKVSNFFGEIWENIKIFAT